jgi:methylated-DNA-[protein]-cysteine S-methyltransferase
MPNRTTFDTSIGKCTILWTSQGISALRLPGWTPKEEITKIESANRGSGKKPEAVTPVAAEPRWLKPSIDKIVAHLDGKPQKLSEIPLDLSGVPHFNQLVYKALMKIPAGQVISYGGLADMAGSPKAARAVGRAMATNPFAIIVPCHRVVRSDGSLGEYSAMEGPTTKKRLLALEGWVPKKGRQ